MMPRPKDDIPASANISRPAILILLISIVCASFASGSLQLIAGVVAGVFLMGFALLGLANLHLRSRNNPAGGILVILAYVVIVLLYLPIYLFAVSGLTRCFNGIPNSTPSKNGK